MALHRRSYNELVALLNSIIPPMMPSLRKGQLGRVGVVGGSDEYTGAPYFSAIAAANLGCDMSHVITTPTAAPTIKSYSPNLMVHPYLDPDMTAPDGSPSTRSVLSSLLSRLHVIVIGPGLGRDPDILDMCTEIIAEAKLRSMPIVLDADGLLLVSKHPSLICGYKYLVMTPNVVEFGRIVKSLKTDSKVDSDGLSETASENSCRQLGAALGGVTIVAKGERDYISDGNDALVVDTHGSLKRCGGQGDTLSGAIATLLAYRKAYHENLWQHNRSLGAPESFLLAAWGGCILTREAARLAFIRKGRSLQGGDLPDEIHSAFLNILGERDS